MEIILGLEIRGGPRGILTCWSEDRRSEGRLMAQIGTFERFESTFRKVERLYGPLLQKRSPDAVIRSHKIPKLWWINKSAVIKHSQSVETVNFRETSLFSQTGLHAHGLHAHDHFRIFLLLQSANTSDLWYKTNLISSIDYNSAVFEHRNALLSDLKVEITPCAWRPIGEYNLS